MFDRHIPIPSSEKKWDFETAQIGDSLGFDVPADAEKFAQAIRKHSRDNGKPWGALVAPHKIVGNLEDKEETRVWIVTKRGCNMSEMVAEINKQHKVSKGLYAASLETDDDIQLSYDPRTGATEVIARRNTMLGEPVPPAETKNARKPRSQPKLPEPKAPIGVEDVIS